MSEAEPDRAEPVGDDGYTQRERDQLSMTSAAFDALERDFKSVLNEVVGGKSLDKFRTEYDKLHHTLKKSHDNERRSVPGTQCVCGALAHIAPPTH